MAEAKPKLASHGQATLALGTLRPPQNLASARPLRACTFGALQWQIQRLSRGSGSLLATFVGDAWRLGAARRAHREWRLGPSFMSAWGPLAAKVRNPRNVQLECGWRN